VRLKFIHLISCLPFARDDWLVCHFSRFCEIYDPHPVEALGFFLSAFSILLLSLMTSDVQRAKGEKRTINFQLPQMIRFSKCVRSFKAICKLISMPKALSCGILELLDKEQIAYAVPLNGASKDDSRTGIVVPAVELSAALSFVPKLWQWAEEKTTDLIRETFQNFDLDHNGVLEYEEFVAMMQILHGHSKRKGPASEIKTFSDPNEIRRLYLEVLSSSEEVTIQSLLTAAFKVATLRDLMGCVRSSLTSIAQTQALVTIQGLLKRKIQSYRQKKANMVSATQDKSPKKIITVE
jgi:hypothetical protein